MALSSRAARMRGDSEAALALAEQAMEALAELGHLEDDEIAVHLARIEALAARGEIERARDATAAAIARLRELTAKLPDAGYWRAYLTLPAHRALRAKATELGVESIPDP
jgi:ATP/maltotriose-dependent transcriptional regulator MalT